MSRAKASHPFDFARSPVRLGYGELLQRINGDRVSSRLTCHFRDGSIDDETNVFSQRGTFHLVSDHHIQRGPFFSRATEFSVDGAGNVSIRSVKGDGKETVETNHIDGRWPWLWTPAHPSPRDHWPALVETWMRTIHVLSQPK